MSASADSPIVTLTTDFGLSDHYVGTMKGVILSLCPEARIIDITHDLTPFSVIAGAYAISQSAPYFPAGTVHVIVVDPGVGTERKAILVKAGDHSYVAPDNGVLTLILDRHPKAVVREITNKSLWLPKPSSTFHGRDIFAPVGAHIASGVKPTDAGRVIHDWQRLPRIHPEEIEPGVWQGIVLSVDRFGNMITNLAQRRGAVEFRGRRIVRFHHTFGEAPIGELFTYWGSSGYLEIGINQENASRELRAVVGDVVILRDTIE